jgi:hypothetical protein
MILHDSEVKLKEGQRLHLFGLGDIHYNASNCDKDRLKRLVEWCIRRKEEGDEVKIIGMGDYNDPLSTSERQSIIGVKGGAGLHDTTLEVLDEINDRLTSTLYRVLEPLTGCFLGLLEGHHYMTFMHSDHAWVGATSTQFLGFKLKTEYFGTLANIKLKFPPSQESLEIVAHHGWGSARTAGGRLTKRERFGRDAFPDANIVMLGHDHTKIAGVASTLRRDSTSPDGVKYVKHYYIGTGSFLKGYVLGSPKGSYVEAGGMAPSDLGVTIVEVTLEKKRGKYRMDYHVSI